MGNNTNPGRIIFALGIISLGILCIVLKDFIVGRPPAWPATIRFVPVLAYGSGALLAAAGLGMLAKKHTTQWALLTALLIFLLSVCRHLPHFMNTWPNAYKSIALAGGCLIMAAAGEKKKNTGWGHPKVQKILLMTGTVLLAVFFLVCGYSHFAYAEFVDTLIPAFIPFHRFWTYFCGSCLLAGGWGILLPKTRKLAAWLSGAMIGGWFLLLHIPRLLVNMQDTSDRLGVCESFTFCGICFVLASITKGKKQYGEQ